MKQKVVYWGVMLLLVGGTFALAITRLAPIKSGLILWAAYWLWSGIMLLLDKNPQYPEWDRWQKQVYGLSFTVLGGLLVVACFTGLSHSWIAMVLLLIPPGLIAFVGRGWYVNKKRSEAWKKQNLTEKD